jgi:hypothetical protein
LLENAHGIFIKCKLDEILACEVKKRKGMPDGEDIDDLLDKVSAIGMFRKLI